MSIEKRKKDSALTFRFLSDDAEFISKFASKHGLEKVRVIELGLDLIRELEVKNKIDDAIVRSVMNRIANRARKL